MNEDARTFAQITARLKEKAEAVLAVHHEKLTVCDGCWGITKVGIHWPCDAAKLALLVLNP
jgi:hypothetical protein